MHSSHPEWQPGSNGCRSFYARMPPQLSGRPSGCGDAFRVWKRSLEYAAYKGYNEAELKFKKLVKRKRNESWRNHCDTLDSQISVRHLWRWAKERKREISARRTLWPNVSSVAFKNATAEMNQKCPIGAIVGSSSSRLHLQPTYGDIGVRLWETFATRRILH